MSGGRLIPKSLDRRSYERAMDREWQSLLRGSEYEQDERWTGEEVREKVRTRVDGVLAFMRLNADKLGHELREGEIMKLYKQYKACEDVRTVIKGSRDHQHILKSHRPGAVALLESALSDREERFQGVFFSSDGDKRFFQRIHKGNTFIDLVNGWWENTATITTQQLEELKKNWHRGGGDFVVREFREGPGAQEPTPGMYRVHTNGIKIPK